ncbi:glycosyltransferase family 39 protein [Paraburkholderia sp. BCC1884]|uniref:glycosyltransferase family 39 protein n=1 Tax=Paraburkholderia sp. BCC1884 TaxID=2562668 RepID=UPI001181CA02|nr:glycosyltransferase family 39 protein [Paraburkholderia sp. BCC1884]
MQSESIETPGYKQSAVDGPALSQTDRVTRARASVKSVGWFVPAVGLVLVLAIAFRLPTLTGRSIWTDEAYSYWFSNLSWTALWTQTPFYETHAPFYYSLLKLWTAVLGSSEAGMRSLSVVASLATVALTGFAPRLLGLGKQGDRVGVVAALLLAINQGNIEYAQQARPYAIQTLFATAMILASAIMLKRLLIDERAAPKISAVRWLYVSAGVFGGLTLWLHNTSPFIIFGNWIGIFGAILLFSANRRRDFTIAIQSLLIALLIWAPCVPITLIESKTVAGAFWATISPKMLTWPFTLAAGGKFAFVPAIIIAALAWKSLYQSNRALALYVASILFIPVAGLFTVSYLFKPVFVTRTFEWMAPVFLFVVAAGLFLPGRMQKLKFVLLPLLLVLCIGQDMAYYAAPTQDLRGAAQYLQANYRKGDLLMTYPNEVQVGLDYYLRDSANGMQTAPLPAKYPAVGWPRAYLQSNRGVPSVIESDRPQIARLLASHKRVWFVGELTKQEDNMSIVASELYRAHDAAVSSAAFAGTPITLFVKP